MPLQHPLSQTQVRSIRRHSVPSQAAKHSWTLGRSSGKCTQTFDFSLFPHSAESFSALVRRSPRCSPAVAVVCVACQAVSIALSVHGPSIVLHHRCRHWECCGRERRDRCTRISHRAAASAQSSSLASVASSSSSPPPCMPPLSSSPSLLICSSRAHSESAVDRPFGAEIEENGTKNG